MTTRTKLELHDAKDAAVQIAKIGGKYVDRHQVTGPDNGPIEVAWDLSKLTPDELKDLLALSRKAEGGEVQDAVVVSSNGKRNGKR